MQPLVTLTTVPIETEAQILKACLAANGIRSTLAGAEVQVAAADLEAAQEFLRSAKPEERRKELSPLAAWIAHIERGLRSVPLPLRVVLLLFGSVWLAGTLGMALAGLLKNFR